MNWDDFRYVLALARGGTLSRAADSLGVHYTSVARRIKQCEDTLGTQLFHHTRRDHVLTDAGAELVAVAERMEDEVFALDRGLLGKDAQLSGALRVAMAGSLARFIGAELAAFVALHPDIDLQIASGLAMHSLTRREADVAIRVSGSPAQHLVGRRVTSLELAPFAAQNLIDRMGERPWSEWPWARLEDRVGGTLGAHWLDEHAPGWSGPFLIDDWDVFEGLLARGVVAGFSGVGLPNVLPQMVQLADGFDSGMGVWVLTHPDLRRTARVRAFMQYIGPIVRDIYQAPSLTAPL